jgi:hypothetical protein
MQETQALWRTRRAVLGVLVVLTFVAPAARADVVTEWNATVCSIVADANVPTPVANQAMTIVQTAVYEAVNAVTKQYPTRDSDLASPRGASVEAAVAAANRAVLARFMPGQPAAVAAAYDAAMAKIADTPARAAGIRVGEAAAAGVMARRAQDTAGLAESYRPHTTPGVYVPTPIPLLSHWEPRWTARSARWPRPSTMEATSRRETVRDSGDGRLEPRGQSAGTNGVLSVNAWTFVGCRYAESGSRVLRDSFLGGVLDRTDTNPLSDPGAFELRIGRRTGTTDWFRGEVDELMIFDRALTDQEILAVFGR